MTIICKDYLFCNLSFIKYCGLLSILKCCLARYSPIIPIANNCAPENMAMIEAKNGNPGTGEPSRKSAPGQIIIPQTQKMQR